MRRGLVITIVVLSWLGLNAPLAGAATGNQWRGWQENEQHAYVFGVYDAWDSAMAWIGEDLRSAGRSPRPEDVRLNMLVTISRCVGGRRMTNEQVAAIVEKYVRDNPARWHKEMTDLIMDALWEACKA